LILNLHGDCFGIVIGKASLFLSLDIAIVMPNYSFIFRIYKADASCCYFVTKNTTYRLSEKEYCGVVAGFCATEAEYQPILFLQFKLGLHVIFNLMT